jgi:hypothetical protein
MPSHVYMCEWSACTKEEVPIVVSLNHKEDRVRFCSLEHLYLWVKHELVVKVHLSRMDT